MTSPIPPFRRRPIMGGHKILPGYRPEASKPECVSVKEVQQAPEPHLGKWKRGEVVPSVEREDIENAIEEASAQLDLIHEFDKQLQSGKTRSFGDVLQSPPGEDIVSPESAEKVMKAYETLQAKGLKPVAVPIDLAGAYFGLPAAKYIKGILGESAGVGTLQEIGQGVWAAKQAFVIAEEGAKVAFVIIPGGMLLLQASQDLKRLEEEYAARPTEELKKQIDDLKAWKKKFKRDWVESTAVSGVKIAGRAPYAVVQGILAFGGEVAKPLNLGFWGLLSLTSLGLASYGAYKSEKKVRGHAKKVEGLEKGRGEVLIESKKVEGSDEEIHKFVEQLEGDRARLNKHVEDQIAQKRELEDQYRNEFNDFLDGLQTGGKVLAPTPYRPVLKLKEDFRNKVEDPFEQPANEVIDDLLAGDKSDAVDATRKALSKAGIDLEAMNEQLLSTKHDPVSSLKELRASEPAKEILLEQYAGQKQVMDMSLRNALRTLSTQKQKKIHDFLRFERATKYAAVALAVAGVVFCTLSILSGVGVLAISSMALPYIGVGLVAAGALVALGTLFYCYRDKPNLYKLRYSRAGFKSVFQEIPLAFNELRLAWNQYQMERRHVSPAREVELKRALFRKNLLGEQVLVPQLQKKLEEVEKVLEVRDIEQMKQEIEQNSKLRKKIDALEKKVKRQTKRLAPYKKSRFDAQWKDYLVQVRRRATEKSYELQKDALGILGEYIAKLTEEGHLDPLTNDILREQFEVDLSKQKADADSITGGLRKFFGLEEGPVSALISRVALAGDIEVDAAE